MRRRRAEVSNREGQSKYIRRGEKWLSRSDRIRLLAESEEIDRANT